MNVRRCEQIARDRLMIDPWPNISHLADEILAQMSKDEIREYAEHAEDCGLADEREEGEDDDSYNYSAAHHELIMVIQEIQDSFPNPLAR